MAVEIAQWEACLRQLQEEIPAEDFNMWLRPLQAEARGDALCLLAPNHFVVDWIKKKFLQRINTLLAEAADGEIPSLYLEVGSRQTKRIIPAVIKEAATIDNVPEQIPVPESPLPLHGNNLNSQFTFDNFVEGKSNQLARAASLQVAQNAVRNPSNTYNPLLLYGGVGLGKTHLMHAIGNHICQLNPGAKVLYLRSEQFLTDLVTALRTSQLGPFKEKYRTADVLMIDDIQFIAGKDRTQEEFFHTFNTCVEGQRQMILTCDKYPKEINGLEERLKSRFGWGLTVAIEPPELETRVAILLRKAEQSQIKLPPEIAFFIAERIRSNVRELEGVLKRVIAQAQFTGRTITLDFVREALKDLLALQDKLVTIENIQRIVAEYYKIKMGDLLSKRRNRSITRPRQMAMLLAKELTSRSLPEIGDAFGGRDHTTVLHACRKMRELIKQMTKLQEDYTNLIRSLST